MTQGFLFESKAEEPAIKYHIPPSDDTETPFCLDCRNYFSKDVYSDGRCSVIRKPVDSIGTCGRFIGGER